MGIYLNEQTLQKVENLTNDIAEIPLHPINKTLDKLEDRVNKSKIGKKVLKGIYTDPGKQSKQTNAKEWATLMGAGSLATHLPMLASGNIGGALGLAAGNAAKGALIGPMLTGGQDTLAKSVFIPAGVMAITTPLFNDAGEALGMDHNPDFDPYQRVGLTGAIGGGMWALRNRKNKDRVYI
jgi:hypothetical protein